jgi:hypothetical protein
LVRFIEFGVAGPCATVTKKVVVSLCVFLRRF